MGMLGWIEIDRGSHIYTYIKRKQIAKNISTYELKLNGFIFMCKYELVSNRVGLELSDKAHGIIALSPNGTIESLSERALSRQQKYA